MSTAFTTEELRAAFDEIGRAAVAAGTSLDIAVYGGAALMLASRFRFSSEDVDIAEIGSPWPDWLRDAVARIASANGWGAEWLNEAVQFHLSPLATLAQDHVALGTFPRGGAAPGLRVFVPSADYMLALKLKAMRVSDPVKGPVEIDDIRHLLRAANVASVDDAVAVLGRYFPRSAADADKQRFLLRHIWPSSTADEETDAARYPVAGD
jgi:hypothetical protein